MSSPDQEIAVFKMRSRWSQVSSIKIIICSIESDKTSYCGIPFLSQARISEDTILSGGTSRACRNGHDFEDSEAKEAKGLKEVKEVDMTSHIICCWYAFPILRFRPDLHVKSSKFQMVQQRSPVNRKKFLFFPSMHHVWGHKVLTCGRFFPSSPFLEEYKCPIRCSTYIS